MTDRQRTDTLRINAICLAGMRDSMQMVLDDLKEQRRTLQRSGMQDPVLDERIGRLGAAIYDLDNLVIDSLRTVLWR